MVKSIILQKRERGEADELVLFTTGDFGWLRGVAKNSRKSRIRFGGHLEPLSLTDLQLRPRKRDNLVWIEDAHVTRGFLHLRSDVRLVAAATHMLEVASLFQGEGLPEPPIFDLLVGFLDDLEKTGLNELAWMLRELTLLELLGHGPRFDACPQCGKPLDPGREHVFDCAVGGVRHPHCSSAPFSLCFPLSPDTLALIRRGLQLDYDARARLRLNARGVGEIRRFLWGYLRYLRGAEINSLVFMEKLGVWS